MSYARRRSHLLRAGFVVGWVALLLAGVLGAAFGGAVNASALAPSDPVRDWEIERVVERVATHTAMPEGIRFSQSVVLRALLFRWEFESELRYCGESLHATTTGAPSFVPESLPQDLVNLGRALLHFDLSRVETEAAGDADGTIVLAGPNPSFDGNGAKEGTFWIDLDRGVVTKAEAVYAWGNLSVEQEYHQHGEHWLLHRQRAYFRPFGATLEVSYGEYRLP